MQRLRQARTLARLVLAWFALTLGIALASPMVKPQGVQLVCSGSGAIQLLVQGGVDGSQPPSTHTLDCPLCATVAPPPPVALAATLPQPLAHAVQPVEAARIAARVAAPLPPRGPPASA